MDEFLVLLKERSRLRAIRVDDELTAALARLDRMLAQLCAALEVEYCGPCVGVEKAEVHRLVVRAHEVAPSRREWGLKVCLAAGEARWRAEWSIQGAGRLRKRLIVQALPEFLAGFAQAVEESGKGETPAGRRVLELARWFNA